MEDHLTDRIAAIRGKARTDSPCPKCDGRGVIARYVYVDGGRCYDCRGTGVDPSRLVASRP